MAFDRYSNLNKLLTTSAKAIEAIEKMRKSDKAAVKKRWGSSDFMFAAKIHLITLMQEEVFYKEIDYLKNSEGQIPNLVNNLNLFLDKSRRQNS